MQMKKYKLGKLMEVTRGMSLGGEFYSTKGELMRLTLGNFDYKNNCFKDDKSKDNLFFTGAVKPEFILKKDDIITPLTEQAIGLLGSTAKIPCDGKYIQSQDVALIKCKEKLNPNFAFYLIPSKLVRNQLSAAAQQTKIRHTSPGKIKDCTVWIPEYSSQEKIGNFLSSIDKKIALNSRINAKLEQMAKRLYDYWFVQFDFPNENGKPYKSSGGKVAYNAELKREIPAGWEVGNLYEIADYINGLACQNFRPKENEQSLPVIKIREMNEGITKDTEQVSINIPEKYKINNGDILFSWSATLEVMVWNSGKGGLNQHIFKVVPKNYFSNEYVYQQLDRYIVNFQKQAEARKTTMGHITSEHINQSRVVLPPKEIVQAFTQKVKALSKMQSNLKTENLRLAIMRDRLLPLLMNGQVEMV
ncbi:restriction endonuclease subunit S [Treponema sp. UBA6852]|uniref:restriction endonuclease subunit S n=1 Tax=Treponema sp. UBA6852 TaxID=1947744 RepID=UPI000E8C9B70|nr:restriction endonuclease subunit S [Treponema sp. UBA6852]HBP10129.1 restriction endonuclease subunit S [Treponema sp.]